VENRRSWPRARFAALVLRVVSVVFAAGLLGCGGLRFAAPARSEPPRAEAERVHPSMKPCVPATEAPPGAREQVARAVEWVRAGAPACVVRAMTYEPGALMVSFSFEAPCEVEGWSLQGHANVAITGAGDAGHLDVCVHLDQALTESEKALRGILGKLAPPPR
jgi:hypothetical protein